MSELSGPLAHAFWVLLVSFMALAWVIGIAAGWALSEIARFYRERKKS